MDYEQLDEEQHAKGTLRESSGWGRHTRTEYGIPPGLHARWEEEVIFNVIGLILIFNYETCVASDLGPNTRGEPLSA